MELALLANLCNNFSQWDIKHITGISDLGQAIVGRYNLTLTKQLIKQKG